MTRAPALLALILLTACPPRTAPGPDRRVEVKPSPVADDALKDARAEGTTSRKQRIEALLSVRKAYPETTAGQDALLEAGLLAYEEGDYATARRTLSELIYENPVHPRADEARLRAGLAALKMKAYQDAVQTLSGLVDRLPQPQQAEAREALATALSHLEAHTEVLQQALRAVEEAPDETARAAALIQLEEVVDSGKTTPVSIAEVWQSMPSSHPAWPLLTMKLARVYYHLRDWARLDETLKVLLAQAPDSAWGPPARALLERVSRRTAVKPRLLGAVLPMSGRYKAFGEATLRGLELGLKGADIELVVKDTQGDPALTARLVEELAFEDGVIAIVGPLLTDDARRAALVAEELDVPLITLSRAEGITAIGPNIFRTMVTNAQQARALATYAIDTMGYSAFAILHPNTPFGVELANAFWDEVESRGAQVRGVEAYDHDQKTFTEEAKKLVGRYYLEDRADYREKMAEIRERKLDEFRRRKAIEKMKSSLDPVIDFEALLIPDSWQQVSLVAPALAVEDIITNACDRRDLERIQKTTRKERLKTVTLLGPSTWSSPKGPSGEPLLIERGGKYVLCSVYVDTFYEGSARPATRAFVGAFREAHRDLGITLLDAIAYDTAGLARSVIDSQVPTTRAAFREGLNGIKGFDGATGSLSFDDRRETRRDFFFLSITTRGIKEVTPGSAPGG